MTQHSFAMLGLLVLPLAVSAILNTPQTTIEAERLRRHFDAVEQELLEADISALTPAQRIARATTIRRLREYADRRAFPRNTDYREPTPYFIDRFGTRCAMAFLVEESGAAEYVQLVSQRMNNASIDEIARAPELGPVLRAWLRDNGLSQSEAARIQPSYECQMNPTECLIEGPTVAAEYAVPAGIFITAGMISIGVNSTGASEPHSGLAAGWIGVTAGALGFLWGLRELPDDSQSSFRASDDEQSFAIASLVVGAVSLFLGAYRVLDAPARESRVNAAPVVTSRGAAGVQLSVNF